MPQPMFSPPKRLLTPDEARQQAMDKASRGPTNMPLPTVPTGRLIPGHSPGSSIWVPGTQPSAPQPSPQPMLQLPSLPPLGEGSLSQRATDGAVRAGPLSTRGAVPVGRGMTPDRRMQMFARRAWTQGDMPTAMNIAGQFQHQDFQRQQQQNYQDFTRQQNDVNFQQGLAMQGMHQQAQAAQDQQARQDRLDMWNADKQWQAQRDNQQWQQQLTMHGLNQGADAMKEERQRQQQQAENSQVPSLGTMPVPGTDYVMPYANGRPMGTLPMSRPQAPLPPGMVPVQAERGGVQYGMPSTKTDRPHIEMLKGADGSSVPHSVHVDQQGNVIMRKVKIIDANGDGIDDRQQMGAGDQGSLSGRKPITTSKGYTWSFNEPKA